jgi:hypothetical protein
MGCGQSTEVRDVGVTADVGVEEDIDDTWRWWLIVTVAIGQKRTETHYLASDATKCMLDTAGREFARSVCMAAHDLEHTAACERTPNVARGATADEFDVDCGCGAFRAHCIATPYVVRTCVVRQIHCRVGCAGSGWIVYDHTVCVPPEPGRLVPKILACVQRGSDAHTAHHAPMCDRRVMVAQLGTVRCPCAGAVGTYTPVAAAAPELAHFTLPPSVALTPRNSSSRSNSL